VLRGFEASRSMAGEFLFEDYAARDSILSDVEEREFAK
jgi:hypothetical protein